MGEAASLTVRFTDRGGVHAAMMAAASALHTAEAPRAVADDLRLALEMMLDPLLVDGLGDGEGGGVLAVAAREGRAVVELRAPGLRLDPADVAPLVDEVDVRRADAATVVAMSRSW